MHTWAEQLKQRLPPQLKQLNEWANTQIGRKFKEEGEQICVIN